MAFTCVTITKIEMMFKFMFIGLIWPLIASGQQLQIDKVTSDYLDNELILWRSIERRAENTLEQIYYNHKASLSEDLFQNFSVRNRLNLNGTLEDALTVVLEKSARAFTLLKNRDYGGLNEFVRNAMENVIISMEDISAISNIQEFWEQLKTVSMRDDVPAVTTITKASKP